ncbi:sensor histidine kinase [Cyclobacterium marinum]|uniref:sensor histidine kinase n=1 Tax=Cyclobacterium marinum TaxID=104 RepID=UPI0011ED95C7|nr:ATP-binding protein [Cyclobacterium marinum]MBI0397230.1 type IV pili methyl-accepting chemotaxis transducer N-terminal domain-containing protein [Cyclobacterium marinum]
MESQDASKKPKFKKLGKYYLVALSAIALSIILSQILVQKFISEQENDSRIVNLSGRQRMLSQKISKCALLLTDPSSFSNDLKTVKELEEALKEWKAVHFTLQSGIDSLGVKTQNSPEVKELFNRINPDFNTIVVATEEILQLLKKNIGSPKGQILKNTEVIISHEASFLRGMDEIVFQYDKEASVRVLNLKNIEGLLLILSLAVIFFEIFFVFIPSAKTIRKTFEQQDKSQRKSKKLTLELSTLYTSLEQAYQDLLEVEVAVEDFTLYAKCEVNGEFIDFSEKFISIMEFEEERPTNIFSWMQDQGYGEDYLKNIQKMILNNKPWTGEIRVVNAVGDFVWLKINLIPTQNEHGIPNQVLMISTDKTEKKEAETISREINKEKIEKKVKEQQFRSALILEGQEEERKRISRDMHDGIGQMLSAMKFNLEAIHSVKINAEKEKLKTVKDLLKDVIREVRRISFNLTPSVLSDYGIVPVLSKFAREITKISDLKVVFENKTGFLTRLEGKIENNIYRICQEAVNNAIKYSEASEVKITLTHNSQYLNLEIADNGKGFDIDKLEEKGHFSTSGHGIFNIRERANFINGDCEIQSNEGIGTTISINIPLE